MSSNRIERQPPGYQNRMTFLIALLILALLFGVGGLVKGVFWLVILAGVLFLAGLIAGGTGARRGV